ncbi:MAG: DUF2807 domain-containing protein [Oscillospiraceae bacterium]|nr:DUF2807 domain-containing protein [Oscillospiraceae bacterium]
MKKIVTAILIAGALLLLGGCALSPRININIPAVDDLVNIQTGIGGVRGTGAMVSHTIETEDFRAIDINVPLSVIYRNDQSQSVTLEIQENLFEYMQVSVRNGTLFVDSSRAFNVSASNTPRLTYTRLILKRCAPPARSGQRNGTLYTLNVLQSTRMVQLILPSRWKSNNSMYILRAGYRLHFPEMRIPLISPLPGQPTFLPTICKQEMHA